MNIVLLFEGDCIEEGRYRLTDHRSRHIRVVLRKTLGSSLKVGLLNGPLGTATVTELSVEGVCLAVTFESVCPPPPRVELLLAIPRPKSLKKVIPQVCAMGLSQITLIPTWRVERGFMGAKILDTERLRPLCHEGLMQGRRTYAPKIVHIPRLVPFLEGRRELDKDKSLLVAHPDGSALGTWTVPADVDVVVAIGPEGGFIDAELALFRDHGFRSVSLGESPLRVETACVSALAQIALLQKQGRALF